MKYKTILADPPWNVSLFSRSIRPLQLPHPYPKMRLNEIKNLKIHGIEIEDLADNQCHLYLWTTHKWLPRSFEVIKAWGFKYHCLLTWDKTYGFTPMSFMWSTEFCLFCQLPFSCLKLKKLCEKTLIKEKPTKHSRKPMKMYDLIEKVSYPPYLELFARPHSPLFPKREGWDAWGDEIV